MKRIVTAAVLVAAAAFAAPASAAPPEPSCQICEKLVAPVRELFRPCGPLVACP